MKTTKFPRSIAAAIAVAALLQSSTASAQLSDAAVTCRTDITKSYNKLVQTAVKTIAGCHKSRDKGDPALTAVDCNDVSLPAVDSKGKFSGAATKFRDAFNAACPNSLSTELVNADHYSSCPYTCAGVPNPMVDMVDVRDCLVCVAAGTAGDAATETLGMPTTPLAESKCHAAVTKGWGKYVTTALKNEFACQAAEDEADDNDLAECTNTMAADPKGKTAAAATKANDGITSACTGANFANLDGCSAVDLASYRSCTETAWETAQDDAFRYVYEMPTTICPATIRTTIFGKCSAVGGTTQGICSQGNETGTELSVGWKGVAHGVDITDGYQLAGDITCPGEEAGSCGDCTIDGFSSNFDQYEDFLRCKDAPWTKCQVPFGTDTDCPSSGPCRYFLGPPLSVSAGGTPTCTLNVVDQDISGTVDPDAGTSELSVRLRSVVHTGISQVAPCPICKNDETPKDHIQDGLCQGGARNNQPCDVMAYDLTFAPNNDLNAITDGPSLDCPPASGANISGAGLAVNLDLTTGTTSKAAEDECDLDSGLNCFCGVCSHDGTLSCNTDNECDLANDSIDDDDSVCGFGGGVERYPNNCSDGVCTPDGTARGTCEGAPDFDTYCSGVLMKNGKGIIPCVNNAGCDAYNTICPGGDCGDCDTFQLRSCFLDPIELTGTPSTTNPILVGTFCLPPSSNGSVNLATGSPGPGAVQTDSAIELVY